MTAPRFKQFSMARVVRLLALLMVGYATTVRGEETVDGAALYQEHCSVCHGDKGDGMTRVRRGLNPPPRDFTTPVARAELDRERMIASVANGRTGTAMMAFAGRLSEAQIVAVVDYVRDHFMLREAVPVDAAMLARAAGERIYISNCAVCHGDDGNGAMWTKSSLNPPPRDFTAPQAAEELSRERMVTSVTHGRPGTAMMAFAARLTPEQIEQVVDYVRGTFLGKAMVAKAESPHGAAAASPHAAPAPAPAAPADMSQPFPDQLAGDPVQGGEFYRKNCFTCHGENGDGNGPRAAFNQPRPRNFLAGDSRRTLNRPALFRAIYLGKPGTVMPAWSKVLSNQEIANVAEFVFQTFIQPTSEPREAPADAESEKKKAQG